MQHNKRNIFLITCICLSACLGACGKVQQNVAASSASSSLSAFAPAPRIDILHRIDGAESTAAAKAVAKAVAKETTEAVAKETTEASPAPDGALSLASRAGGSPDFVSSTVDVASDRHRCMGTMIAENMVLTAAHCLYYKATGGRAADNKIRARLSKNGGWVRARRTATLKAFKMPAGGERTTYAAVAADVAVIELVRPLSARARAIPLFDGGAATVLIPGISPRANTATAKTATKKKATTKTSGASASRSDEFRAQTRDEFRAQTRTQTRDESRAQTRAKGGTAAPSCNRSHRAGPISLYDCVVHHGDSGSGVWSAPRAGQPPHLVGVVSSIAAGGVAVVDATQARRLVEMLQR